MNSSRDLAHLVQQRSHLTIAQFRRACVHSQCQVGSTRHPTTQFALTAPVRGHAWLGCQFAIALASVKLTDLSKLLATAKLLRQLLLQTKPNSSNGFWKPLATPLQALAQGKPRRESRLQARNKFCKCSRPQCALHSLATAAATCSTAWLAVCAATKLLGLKASWA